MGWARRNEGGKGRKRQGAVFKFEAKLVLDMFPAFLAWDGIDTSLGLDGEQGKYDKRRQDKTEKG